MRYLGNKDSINNEIVTLLKEKGLYMKGLVFFDAFCGTGTIANSLKDIYKIVLNDNMILATTFSEGRLYKNKCKFIKLGFNPVEYFNSNEKTLKGFFTLNYSPKFSNRMYFSDFNAGRIDYFRNTIEKWHIEKKIYDYEYKYLLCCLLESVSKVANIAGVYGAYLKKWDPRAIKKIIFREPESQIELLKYKPKVYHDNIINIIDRVNCDILYLDPPYTKNKYSVQYHILETLILNDNPSLTGITGCRQFDYISDSWSINNKVEIEFDNVIANTKSKHIIISYSDDGILSKEYILLVLKRYCESESICFKEINYKKYRNYKTTSTNQHHEYLFYGKKKNDNDVNYCCPLNYMGGKSNIIDSIKPYIKGKGTFIDIMGGGFNVGINANGFNKYIYNDINHILKDLIMMFKNEDTYELLKFIESIIKKYKLEKHNKITFQKYRDEYNKKYRFRKDYYKYLYVLILYGFQQQLRFNSNYEFNNTVGESGYNECIKEKFVSFSRRIKRINLKISNKSYEELISIINSKSVVYFDPPYLITLGSYNDGKRGFFGWNEEEEKRLIAFFDNLKRKNCRFIISNILSYKGKDNTYLLTWIKQNKDKTKIVEIEVRKRKEVLIIYG